MYMLVDDDRRDVAFPEVLEDDDMDEDDDHIEFPDHIQFTMTPRLHKSLGRSSISILREYYRVLLSTPDQTRRNSFSTPLHIEVALSKDLEGVEYYLKNDDANKNSRNVNGETPLLLAIKENVDEHIVNLLLEYGCDVTIGTASGITPLHFAVLDNKIDLMRLLIEKGADVNAESTIGVTPLHLAILASHFDAVSELLRHNANPTLVTTLHFTPLMLALGFADVDIRIIELLCVYDLNIRTRVGNALYCAMKACHHYAYNLLAAGADVNYVGDILGVKTSCILEAVTVKDKSLFHLIWSKTDSNVLRKKLKNFLVYFADNCGLRGSDLVDCLTTVLKSPHGTALIKSYYNERQKPFLQNFFDQMNYYRLTSDNCCEMISALPIITYNDICYIYRKFNFSKELEKLLESYEHLVPWTSSDLIPSTFVDYICYNTNKNQMYNLKEIVHFLRFYTPNPYFRIEFFNLFSSLSSCTDEKLNNLVRLYKIISQKLGDRSIASLQELSRDNVRKTLFKLNRNPYKAINQCCIPEIIKDILSLKTPIYC